MHDVDVCLERIVDDLPEGFDELRAEAVAENRRMVERLASDWLLGTMRFDHVGEALMAVRVKGVLAGIGGLTREPVLPDAMRMRRFYVRPSFRRSGIGSTLAFALIEEARRTTRCVTVNAGAGSAPFWEALGFSPDMCNGHSHVLHLETVPVYLHRRA